MKKAFEFLYIVIFFIICVVPFIFFSIGNTNNNQTEGNKLEKPKLIENNKIDLQYPIKMESYFLKNFGFRTKMVNMFAEMNYKFLGESSSSKVIVGQDDWLFYSETLNDFFSRETLNNLSIKQLARTLELMKEYIESKGARFYFTIAPNKNSIYPEYMPKRYLFKKNENNYQLLKDELKNFDINFIDLKDFLLSKKDENIKLYHKKDSHWNYYGAEQVYRELLLKMDFNTSLKDDLKYSIEKVFYGDIYRMLFPEGKEKDEQFIYNFPKNYVSGRPFQEEDIKITTKLKNGQVQVNPGKSLIIFRDSFFNSLVQFFSNDFAQVQYTREIPYLIKDVQDQVVLLEIVERNIPKILNSAPVMLAPIRENLDLSKLKRIERKNIFFKKDEENDQFHLFGYYKEKISSNEQIFIGYDNKLFEAFPILEEKLSDEAIDKYGKNIINQGFSLRLPKDISVYIDDFDVYVIK